MRIIHPIESQNKGQKMKAEYILKAIAALKLAEDMLDIPKSQRTPEMEGHVWHSCFIARVDLEIHSGLEKVEIPIEQEAA